MKQSEELVGRLTRAGLTVCAAESCTGGALCARIVDAAGASAAFKGGVVSYTEQIKSRLLGVSPDLISLCGVVSEEVAAAMAEGARKALGTDLAVSTTGVAGPSGGTEQAPLGTVCIGISGALGTRTCTLHLTGSRDEVRGAAVDAALTHLLAYLSEQGVF